LPEPRGGELHEATSDQACCFKPNLAFYERFGRPAATLAPLNGAYYRSMYLPPNGASNAAFLATLRLMLVHETTDPELIIAELDAVVVEPASGARHRVRQIHVVRVRDELIIEHRDYFAGASADVVRQALGTTP
jgi:hypothetical protein